MTSFIRKKCYNLWYYLFEVNSTVFTTWYELSQKRFIAATYWSRVPCSKTGYKLVLRQWYKYLVQRIYYLLTYLNGNIGKNLVWNTCFYTISKCPFLVVDNINMSKIQDWLQALYYHNVVSNVKLKVILYEWNYWK